MRKLFIICCLLLTACGTEVEQPGVVATVNGRPIFLEEVKARHDLNTLSWTGGVVPSVEGLRDEYGKVLSELIINALVASTLHEMGMPVTDEELVAAESEVRADYPEDQFEKLLVEEYIDVNVWRSMLRQQLAMQKFKAEVLRPQVKLSYQEAEAYYKKNIADFYLPPRLHFVRISGSERTQVEQARELFLQEKNIENVRSTYHEVAIRELKMRHIRLPETWSRLLQALGEGEASAVVTGESGFECVVLLERLPEKVLGPSHAYPLVERVLLEQKVQQVFDAWLAKTLDTATVKISRHLLKQAEEKKTAAEDIPTAVKNDTAETQE